MMHATFRRPARPLAALNAATASLASIERLIA
jgi:hypothetical protein